MLRRSFIARAPSKKGGDKLRAGKTSNPRVFTFDNPNPTSTGVVSLVGWLYSKNSTLAKYAEVYHSYGMDVVCCTPTWTHVMKPDEGLKLMHALEEEVTARKSRNENNMHVLHAFSMGAYLTSMWTKSMRERDAEMLKTLKMQAYDSPVDYDHVPRGIGEATFDNKQAAKAVEASIKFALQTFPETRKRHMEASDDFWNKPLACPSVWFYSECDAISPAKVCEQVMQTWEKNHNISCKRVLFENTKHVTHYRVSPDQYKKQLSQSLEESTGLRPKS